MDALVVGAFQGVTILPGIPQASVFLFRGYEGPAVFRLSFLLSIPAGLGAGLLILIDEELATTCLEAVVALVVSVIAGYVILDVIMQLIHRIDF